MEFLLVPALDHIIIPQDRLKSVIRDVRSGIPLNLQSFIPSSLTTGILL